jgi:hypothetical protein
VRARRQSGRVKLSAIALIAAGLVALAFVPLSAWALIAGEEGRVLPLLVGASLLLTLCVALGEISRLLRR